MNFILHIFFPENFEKRVVQYLLQLANRQLAEAFQHCKYEYEDVGLAYYAGLRGDNWNKKSSSLYI